MLVYQFWAHVFWVPKLRMKSQPTTKCHQTGLNSIILSQYYHWKTSIKWWFLGFALILQPKLFFLVPLCSMLPISYIHVVIFQLEFSFNISNHILQNRGSTERQIKRATLVLCSTKNHYSFRVFWSPFCTWLSS